MIAFEEKSIKETTTPEPTDECSNSPDLATQIADCAYYKAEKRGFEPGYETADWYEAEKEILGSISAASIPLGIAQKTS